MEQVAWPQTCPEKQDHFKKLRLRHFLDFYVQKIHPIRKMPSNPLHTRSNIQPHEAKTPENKIPKAPV